MKTLVIASGYFNPLGSHHIDYLQASYDYGDRLIIILNNDTQVKLKNSIPFQSYNEREKILSHLAFIGVAECKLGIIWRCMDEDETVCKTLEKIWEFNHNRFDKILFCNGGDRVQGNPKEQEVCDRLGIEMIFGVGGNKKTGSSSDLIANAGREWAKRNGYTSWFPNPQRVSSKSISVEIPDNGQYIAHMYSDHMR